MSKDKNKLVSNYISDSGIVESKALIKAYHVSAVCYLVSIGLIVLGVLAYVNP